MHSIRTTPRSLAVFAVAFPFAVGALACQSTATSSDADARLTSEIRYLADDGREGRGVGTKGLDEAAQYVADQFREVGLEPGGSDGYFQPFDISPTAPGAAHTNLGGSHVKNVIGLLPGHGSLATQVVVLGAHYDHLGLGLPGFSLDPDSTGAVHNGADDNASGTVALMETARMLAARDGDANRRTFVFVAFTAEELGTIGSLYYAAHPVQPNDSTLAMINFDMVGRLRGDSLVVIGVGSAEELTQLVEQADSGRGLTLAWQQDPWGRSDHSSFYAQHIPVVHFFTNLHDDYHRSTDDWQKINIDGIERISGLAADLAWEFATRPERLTFLEVAPPPPPSTGHRASLGTIPDMTDSPGGVRLTGVRSGSAADEAGLQAGDIIVQIGQFEVKDLQGLQTALVSLSSGDSVTIVYLRNGERREAQATLR